MVCREGTRHCGVGAWDQIRLGAGVVRQENLAEGNAAQSPGFWLLPLGSPLELGGGIVDLGPVSEPLLVVAWSVPSKGGGPCHRLSCRASLFILFSPPLFQFTAYPPSLAHWPPGETRGCERTFAHGLTTSEELFSSGGPNSF